MKIICAGAVKTGTKSLHSALEILGYSVYDFTEQFYYQHEDWEKVFNGKATIEDFRRMYENVDALIDIPGHYFWKEILNAFPDAKVILSVRDSEEVWYKSLLRHVDSIRQEKWFYTRLYCTPIGWKWIRHLHNTDTLLYGMDTFNIFGRPLNKISFLQHYRRQMADVKQNTPKGQLLVYNCKEGWEPLCEFLGVPVPEDRSFPYKNSAPKNFCEDFIEVHPVYKAISRQFKCTVTIALATICLGVFTSLKYFKKI